MTEPKEKNDEIIFMDEVADEVSEPLADNLEAMITPPSGSMLETDNTNNPQPTSGPEIDDLKSDDSSMDMFCSGEVDDISLNDQRPAMFQFPGGRMPFFPPPPVSTAPDVNLYQYKKTIAQGMMDLALVSANANQLRYVLHTDGGHSYYYPSLAMICASLFLQIAVGIGLIWNSRYNVKNDSEMCKAVRANNYTVIGIFLVTILNVFISSFGIIGQMAVGTT
ncbi:ninjurin-A-like [Osmia bicornis bicornis]|uniref:ninjurin-A-like n=1 Tax=Osmia bicornis bicornis TaxID=1437191 RepID=UPI001EAEF620|nr:ninjurin-A-like [Osmia bicornis bicornis]